MNPDQLRAAKRVARLITGYLNNDLSNGERKELDDWLLESTDNMALFEKLTDENNLQESMQWFRNIDEQAPKIDIDRKINTRKTRKAYPLYWAAAACILIAFGYWLYDNNRTSEAGKVNNIVRVEQNEILPGKKRAVLITGSGDEIVLDSTVNQQIDIGDKTFANNNGEQLVYTPQRASTFNTLQVPAGGQYQVVLADGTKVWLNSMSQLSYPTSFNGNIREVELQGEGYFEVKHDTKKPFFVKTENAQIKVTGTSFNVHSYADENVQKVTLINGSIDLLAGENTQSVKPNQDAVFNAGGILYVSNNSAAAEAAAWTKGLFGFHKASIEEVMQQITRWYGIQVKYEGKPIKQFTGNIPMKSTLSNVLRMLEMSGNVHFSLHDSIITVRP